MKILRWFGFFFFGLLTIGALLSILTPLLPHPRDLPFPLLLLISAPLLVYFSVEVFSLLFEAIGLIKRGASVENKTRGDSPDKKPKPRS
jgi:hypothetical protein